MSQNEDESVIMNILNEYVQIHDKGFGAFNDLINPKTDDDVKSILTTFVRAYFVETSILFRLAAASVPAIISLRQSKNYLLEKNLIKSKVKQNHNMTKWRRVLKSLETRSKTELPAIKWVRIFTDKSAYHDGRIPRIEVCGAI
jgi:hypothetical protein